MFIHKYLRNCCFLYLEVYQSFCTSQQQNVEAPIDPPNIVQRYLIDPQFLPRLIIHWFIIYIYILLLDSKIISHHHHHQLPITSSA